MVDMLDGKMFSLNEAITAFAKRQQESQAGKGLSDTPQEA